MGRLGLGRAWATLALLELLVVVLVVLLELLVVVLLELHKKLVVNLDSCGRRRHWFRVNRAWVVFRGGSSLLSAQFVVVRLRNTQH